VNFGSPQPGSYGLVSIDMAPHCWVRAAGGLPIQGKLGMVLRGSATLSQGHQKRVRRRGRQRALSFRARRTRYEPAGVSTHMVRCHVGHCIFRTVVQRLRLRRRSRSPKYAWWLRRRLFSSRYHWYIDFAPSSGRTSSNTLVKDHIWTTRDNTV
jgi:hypothetical protein